jgi:large subunit ribosomal protein L14e
MIYNKYVELGRVVFIAKGKEEGKLAVVVNVVDGNRVSRLRLFALNVFYFAI